MSLPNDTENLVLEHLRAIRSSIERMEFDVNDVKKLITSTEEAVVGLQRRIDRVDERLDRIEKRLELMDV